MFFDDFLATYAKYATAIGDLVFLCESHPVMGAPRELA
jgi:hypothetical protein